MEKGEKKQGRRTYTQEFKLEAVRLVRTGIPKARVARPRASSECPEGVVEAV